MGRSNQKAGTLDKTIKLLKHRLATIREHIPIMGHNKCRIIGISDHN